MDEPDSRVAEERRALRCLSRAGEEPRAAGLRERESLLRGTTICEAMRGRVVACPRWSFPSSSLSLRRLRSERPLESSLAGEEQALLNCDLAVDISVDQSSPGKVMSQRGGVGRSLEG